MRAGDVFAPMHWTDQFSSSGPVGGLVHALTDPVSGQPDLKGTKVEVSIVAELWRGVLLRRADDPEPLVAEGVWRGEIASVPRGAGGFGYDPLFYLPGRRCTSAELDADQKNRISHRGQALARLLARLSDEDRA